MRRDTRRGASRHVIAFTQGCWVFDARARSVGETNPSRRPQSRWARNLHPPALVLLYLAGRERGRRSRRADCSVGRSGRATCKLCFNAYGLSDSMGSLRSRLHRAEILADQGVRRRQHVGSHTLESISPTLFIARIRASLPRPVRSHSHLRDRIAVRRASMGML